MIVIQITKYNLGYYIVLRLSHTVPETGVVRKDIKQYFDLHIPGIIPLRIKDRI